jgi:hypothetical protein
MVIISVVTVPGCGVKAIMVKGEATPVKFNVRFNSTWKVSG